MHQQSDINILQDIEQDIYLERVGPGIRFANFMIDTLVYYGVLIVGLGFFIFGTGQDVDNTFLTREDGGSVALQYLISLASYLGFFTVLEGATKGKTLCYVAYREWYHLKFSVLLEATHGTTNGQTLS
ncbi:MAG: hypothetical protein ACXWCG_06135 [Flavitalea sp.]